MIILSIVYSADLATLQEVWNSMVQKWISPIVIMVMGTLSLKFLLNRQWSQFINFLSIGIGVAVVVYIAPEMFNQNSDLMNSASDTAKMINWNEYDWIVWYIIYESNPYPIMKPVRIQITGFIVFDWKSVKIDAVHRAEYYALCGRHILLKPWKTAFMTHDTRNVENRCQNRNERSVK